MTAALPGTTTTNDAMPGMGDERTARLELQIRLDEAEREAPGQETVSVVIPAKNEAKNIGWVLERLPDLVDEVVLVDGFSSDGTAEVARSVRRDIRVVSEDRPGKGAALRAGFAAAGGDIVVMLDADGSMDPAEISRYIALLSCGYDLVKGSRFMAGADSTDITRLRRLGNRCLLGLVNVLYRAHFTDLCYGYVAFRRRALDTLVLTAGGFEIETQLVVQACTAGLRITEVPSLEAPRRYGQSNLRTFRDGQRVLRIVVTESLAARRGRRQGRRAPEHLSAGALGR